MEQLTLSDYLTRSLLATQAQFLRAVSVSATKLALDIHDEASPHAERLALARRVLRGDNGVSIAALAAAVVTRPPNAGTFSDLQKFHEGRIDAYLAAVWDAVAGVTA
jgi:hypothetical protein